MDLFAHIFYTLVGVYLAFCILVVASNKLAKMLLDILLIVVVLSVASIAIMGGMALIQFLSGVIM